MKSGGIAALAAGLALVALPSVASAEQRDGDRWQRQSENRSERGTRNDRWGQRQQAAAQAQSQTRQQPAPPPQSREQRQVQAQQAPQARTWVRQDGRDGQRNNRRDNSDGAILQQRVDTQRTEAQRNSRYTDPRRNGSYVRDGDRRQDWNDRERNTRYAQDRNWDRKRSTNWNHDWRRDNRYNWSNWRQTHRNTFRLGRYSPPYRNYSYRPLRIGFYLDSMFFGSSYWISDPWQYRLPPAYGPYRWVRYYDDALLVDIYSGEVVDVLRDFFW
ncbi:MAG: RcnB family protein [Novosphingobium sp.]